MSKKEEKGNLRMLDKVTIELNWLGRLSYVEEVLYGKKRAKKDNTKFVLLFFLLAFSIGLVSGLLIYYLVNAML